MSLKPQTTIEDLERKQKALLDLFSKGVWAANKPINDLAEAFAAYIQLNDIIVSALKQQVAKLQQENTDLKATEIKQP
jgi:hypothetical protein